jgi:hypothetical protein
MLSAETPLDGGGDDPVEKSGIAASGLGGGRSACNDARRTRVAVDELVEIPDGVGTGEDTVRLPEEVAFSWADCAAGISPSGACADWRLTEATKALTEPGNWGMLRLTLTVEPSVLGPGFPVGINSGPELLVRVDMPGDRGEETCKTNGCCVWMLVGALTSTPDDEPLS